MNIDDCLSVLHTALSEHFANNYSYHFLLGATDDFSRVSKQLKFFKVFDPALDACWVIEDVNRSKYQVRHYIRDQLSTPREDFKVIDGLLPNQFIVIASSDVMVGIKLLALTPIPLLNP